MQGNKKTIAVVGPGYVGQGIVRLFGDQVQAIYSPSGNSVPQEFKDKHLDTKEAVNACDLITLAVPTPMSENGECDLSHVLGTLEWLREDALVLIKSTIVPGTTEMLQAKYPNMRIAFSPEYMGEGNYFTPFWKYPDPKEMKYHSFQIFGGVREATNAIVNIFQRVMGPHVFYAQTDSRTAEFVKYFENLWGAMKVTFANEMYEAARVHSVDYIEARELWALDSRVEKMHTAVFPDKRGFSGKCFPKDVRAFIEATKKLGYDPKLLSQVWNTNIQWHEEFKPIEEEKE